ncbi:hypothetical protein EDB85DRAFT_2292291 [Lactarius pseudohatsudake]|nr:hypothetical protein EDB85DRAFT_2292291 [Lactarius pseudohatsudake]
MSEEQPRWLERNVDVLVQLLQSGAFLRGLLLSPLYVFNVVVDGFITFADEPEEVAVIKMVLIQHLELDSKVTLGILCDQIVLLDDPMEVEDKTIRERPELHGQRRGVAEQEDALIDTLIKAVSTSSTADAAKIIEDILVFLPSFNDGRKCGAGTSCAQGGPPARAEPGAADLAQLLRFYCTSSLMGKMTLGRLPQDSCTFFIARLAGALAACSHRKSPESSELASMRWQVVDVLTTILSFFIQVAPSDAQLMNKSPESKQVADLSKALTRHPLLGKPPPSPPPNTKELVDAPLLSKRKAGGQAPGMPEEQNGTQKLSIWGQHVYQRRHPKDITSSSSPQQSMCSGVSTPVEAADDGD